MLIPEWALWIFTINFHYVHPFTHQLWAQTQTESNLPGIGIIPTHSCLPIFSPSSSSAPRRRPTSTTTNHECVPGAVNCRRIYCEGEAERRGGALWRCGGLLAYSKRPSSERSGQQGGTAGGARRATCCSEDRGSNSEWVARQRRSGDGSELTTRVSREWGWLATAAGQSAWAWPSGQPSD